MKEFVEFPDVNRLMNQRPTVYSSVHFYLHGGSVTDSMCKHVEAFACIYWHMNMSTIVNYMQ